MMLVIESARDDILNRKKILPCTEPVRTREGRVSISAETRSLLLDGRIYDCRPGETVLEAQGSSISSSPAAVTPSETWRSP